MATILALPPRHEKNPAKRRSQKPDGAARVIIFPGVRYERIPEASIAISKPAKKTLKTA
jgi:hypothetical protein